jgi:hypothetical protein
LAKLTARKMARRDGTLNINGYTATLAKVPTEQSGFDENTEIEIEYKKDKIIIKKAN